jgi:DNA end-binding protein Ku
MVARSMSTATISFGLVTVPIRLYAASETQSAVSFNLLHEKCHSRLKQQYICPKDEEIVGRDQMVKGYEFSKDQYVVFTEDEIKSMAEEASKTIEITEFVPLAKVDPIYFEGAYYLGPDKGGEKAYRLLSEAMEKAGQVALAKFVMRGKETVVLIRAAQSGLMLHTMYFADEVRNFDEIDKGASAKIKDGELDLALQLINGLASETFSPDRYTDEYRHRVLEMLNQKAEGQEITVAEPAAPRAQVIDLMEALKESLAKRGLPAEAADAKKPPTKAGNGAAAKPKAAEAAAPKKRAQGGRK